MHIQITNWVNEGCEGHATARQYLSSLGLGHYHPSQESIATPIQSRTQLSMAIFPGGQYLSSLRLNYFQPWHPSRLGPTPRQVSRLRQMPTQGGSRSSLTIPLITSYQRKPCFNLSLLSYEVISLELNGGSTLLFLLGSRIPGNLKYWPCTFP